jgi:hypothetical protein
MGIGHVADISGLAETRHAGRSSLVGWHPPREILVVARLLYWLGGPFGLAIVWLLIGLTLLGVIRF